MKKLTPLLIFVLLIAVAIETAYILNQTGLLMKPLVSVKKVTPKPLLSYTFTNLKNLKFPQNPIIFGKVTSENNDSISQVFYFLVPKTPGSNVMEKVSGLANIPKKTGTYPVIVMFRGFVPDNI